MGLQKISKSFNTLFFYLVVQSQPQNTSLGQAVEHLFMSVNNVHPDDPKVVITPPLPIKRQGQRSCSLLEGHTTINTGWDVELFDLGLYPVTFGQICSSFRLLEPRKDSASLMRDGHSAYALNTRKGGVGGSVSSRAA